MSERPSLEDEIRDVLRPLVVEVVADELERRGADRHDDQGPAPFLTVAQYAELHQTTPAAVRARIRRGALEAIRPPGGREYLIPNDMRPGGQWRRLECSPQKCPRTAPTAGG